MPTSTAQTHLPGAAWLSGRWVGPSAPGQCNGRLLHFVAGPVSAAESHWQTPQLCGGEGDCGGKRALSERSGLRSPYVTDAIESQVVRVCVVGRVPMCTRLFVCLYRYLLTSSYFKIYFMCACTCTMRVLTASRGRQRAGAGATDSYGAMYVLRAKSRCSARAASALNN